MYSAGHLEYPSDDDARFAALQEAVTAAAHGSIDDSVWAVWYDESEIMAICYRGTAYRP